MNERFYQSVMIGSSSGGILLTGTAAHTVNADALVMNEDTVFAALETDGESVLAARGLTGKTVTLGMFLGAGLNYKADGQKKKFTKVTLTSGSVIAY